MNQTRFLSIIGISPDLRKQLQQLLSTHLKENLSVAWGKATDPQVQGVIINAQLIQSPQIQSFISAKQLNFVCLYSDPNDSQLAQEVDFPCLNIANHDNYMLLDWLSALLGEKNTDREIFKEKYIKGKPNKDSILTQGIINKDNSPTLKPSNSDYKTLLTNIERKAGLYLVTHKNNHTWVDPKNNVTFLDFDRDKIPAIESVSWCEVDQDNFKPTTNTKRLDLNLWLFETLWQSQDQKLITVNAQGLYKLTRWPRPLSHRGRSEALRLAAFIQKNPMSSKQLSQKSGYDKFTTERFLNAGLKTSQVIKTGNEDIGLQEKLVETKQVDAAKMSLLGRIRQKLKL